MNWKPLILLVALMAAAGHAHEVEEMGNGDVQVNGAGKEELVGFATTDTLKSASYDELMEEAVRRGLIKEDHAEEEEKEYEIRESRDDGGYGIPSAVSTDDELGEEMRTQKNVDQVFAAGITTLKSMPLEENGEAFHVMIQDLKRLLPVEMRTKMSVGEDADPAPATEAAPATVVPAEGDKSDTPTDAVAQAIAECDKKATFVEKAACIDDAKRFKAPPCEFSTQLYHTISQMDQDPAFMKKGREARGEAKQTIIVNQVKAYQKIADSNQNGTIEPDELKGIIDKLQPMMNDNAQIGKCTYTKPQ